LLSLAAHSPSRLLPHPPQFLHPPPLPRTPVDEAIEKTSEEIEETTPEPTEAEVKAARKKEAKRRAKLLTSSTDFTTTLSSRGIMYISHIPPKMTVSKMKTLLSPHGEVTRIYLEEEDKSKRKRRKKAGGGGGKRYTEGWIEFSLKRDAKAIALGLHMTPMEKRGTHADDLWNVRYLKGFKWDMLTEKVAYERRVRDQKLKIEMINAKKEIKEFERRVEEGEKFEKMESRKRKKGESVVRGREGGGREFKQRKVLQDD
jgi:ESF2/ABP1 family protein